MKKVVALLVVLSLSFPLLGGESEENVVSDDNQVIFKVKQELNNKYGKFLVLKPGSDVALVGKVVDMGDSAKASQWLTCDIDRVELPTKVKDEVPIRMLTAKCSHGIKLEIVLLIFPPAEGPAPNVR